MIPNAHDTKVLQAIRKHCVKAVKLVGKFGSYQEFSSDEDAPAALAMYLTQIGELAKTQLSDEVKGTCEAIPWKAMYGLRNRIVHGYGELEFSVIWQTAQEDIPGLVQEINTILSYQNVSGSFGKSRPLEFHK